MKDKSFRVAKMIESAVQFWIMDEFCAILDPSTAKNVAVNVQKLARKHRKWMRTSTAKRHIHKPLHLNFV